MRSSIRALLEPALKGIYAVKLVLQWAMREGLVEVEYCMEDGKRWELCSKL
jgi:hypothetical protein